MKKLKSHFKFDKQERNGIFFLLLLIVFVQVALTVIRFQQRDYNAELNVDTRLQKHIDSLKQTALTGRQKKVYPFNPNFITDYKGYTLGLTPSEIDRLHKFRESGKYVNSAAEFQKVTKVSDSVLHIISPYFKFPEWSNKGSNDKDNQVPKTNTSKTAPVPHLKKDLNTVTAEELRYVNGIGSVLSKRIIKFRDRLGGFQVGVQLYDVYGLDKQVADRVLKRFQVVSPPTIARINVNSADIQELQSLIYISRDLANEIVTYRNAHGPFEAKQELALVPGFPKDKIDRIGLYLSFEND